VSSEPAALRLYAKEIAALLAAALAGPHWPRKKAAAEAAAAIAQARAAAAQDVARGVVVTRSDAAALPALRAPHRVRPCWMDMRNPSCVSSSALLSHTHKPTTQQQLLLLLRAVLRSWLPTPSRRTAVSWRRRCLASCGRRGCGTARRRC
jgi:hypothetical protein